MSFADAPGLPEGGLKFMRSVVAPYVNRHWDIHERGQGNVPEEGPVILASNHIGWLDGPLLFVTPSQAARKIDTPEEIACVEEYDICTSACDLAVHATTPAPFDGLPRPCWRARPS